MHAWYRRSARVLPWRETSDPYRVWLAEIILQQTRVVQGLPYYERFLKKFPTVHHLASAPLDDVLKCWEGLGYYTRARNLHRCAKAIVEQHGGSFPGTAEALQLLPGIGRYTAAAIASIAFHEPVAVLDGNVIRVISRWFDLADNVDLPTTRENLWQIASELLPRRGDPGIHNQAMMELGARICTYRAPQCDTCPVRRYCLALAAGTVADRPVRDEKKPLPHYQIVVAIIHKNGRYLVGRRPEKGMLGGLWEFPGGKIAEGESHEEALQREVMEETGATVEVKEALTTVQHAYSHFRVTLYVYRCVLAHGTPRPRWHTELRWIRRKEFTRYAFPQANRKFLHLLD